MRWLLLLFLFIPSLASSGEYCSDSGGSCKDACEANETAEAGGFIDCTDRQDCCVVKEDMQSAEPGKEAPGKAFRFR